MEIVLNNVYILIWAALLFGFAYILYKTHVNAKEKAEENEKEYDILENRKFWKILAAGIILVVLYAMILPMRSDQSRYNERVDFISEFEKVSEEDKVKGGPSEDLTDESRRNRLEELRMQNQKISEEVEEEMEENTQTKDKGDNQ